MMKTAALLALAPVVAASAVNRNFLSAEMQPDVVAHTLLKVENGWMSQAASFAHCSVEGGDCSEPSELFTKSCSQVVNSVVQGSNGDKAQTAEYMQDVCGQKALAGWHKTTCFSLRKALSQKMSDSVFDNRETFKLPLNAKKVCDLTWTNLVDQQKKEVLKEVALRKEEEKKEQEQEAKLAEAKQHEKKAEEAAAEAKLTEEKQVSLKKVEEAEAEAKAEVEAKEKEMKQQKVEAEKEMKAAEWRQNSAKAWQKSKELAAGKGLAEVKETWSKVKPALVKVAAVAAKPLVAVATNPDAKMDPEVAYAQKKQTQADALKVPTSIGAMKEAIHMVKKQVKAKATEEAMKKAQSQATLKDLKKHIKTMQKVDKKEDKAVAKIHDAMKAELKGLHGKIQDLKKAAVAVPAVAKPAVATSLFMSLVRFFKPLVPVATNPDAKMDPEVAYAQASILEKVPKGPVKIEAMKKDLHMLKQQVKAQSKAEEKKKAQSQATLKDLKKQVKVMQKAEKKEDKAVAKTHAKLKVELEGLRAKVQDLKKAAPAVAKPAVATSFFMSLVRFFKPPVAVATNPDAKMDPEVAYAQKKQTQADASLAEKVPKGPKETQAKLEAMNKDMGMLRKKLKAQVKEDKAQAKKTKELKKKIKDMVKVEKKEDKAVAKNHDILKVELKRLQAKVQDLKKPAVAKPAVAKKA